MVTAKTNRAIYTFTIEGQPVPKARPRFSKGRIYTPAKTAAAEEAIAWEVKKQIKKPLKGNIAMGYQFWVKGKKHGDLSNLIKLVEDGCNGVAFLDDIQIKKYKKASIFYSNKPKTVFTIGELKGLNSDL